MKKNNLIILLLLFINNIATGQSSVIGKTNKIGNLEISQFDFPQKMNLYQAENACKSLGNGWRLPNLSESKIIFQYKNDISNLKNDIYWCSKDEYGDPWRFSTVNGMKMLSLGRENAQYYVRAVKSK
jgi:hypothetical protein